MAAQLNLSLEEDGWSVTFSIQPDEDEDGAIVRISGPSGLDLPMAFVCSTAEMRALLVEVIRKIDELPKSSAVVEGRD